MQRYLDLDVHAASSTLVVLSQSGKRLGQSLIGTNDQALVVAMVGRTPDQKSDAHHAPPAPRLPLNRRPVTGTRKARLNCLSAL